MRTVLLFAPAVVGIFIIACIRRGPSPEQAARNWATELHIPVGGVSCTETDTDGDGYVSCSIAKPDGELVALDCATGWGFASGCKQKVLPKIRAERAWD